MMRILLFILLTTSLFAREYIAIIDFEGIGVSENEARALTQRLTSEIIALEVYQIVERSEMKRLLDEQKFQYSGCADITCAVDIGKLIGAKYMVVGSVSKLGSAYSLDSRMISVETGESYISGKYSVQGGIEILLFEGMTSIAHQLCEVPFKETAKSKQVIVPPIKPTPPVVQVTPKVRVIIKSNPLGSIVYLDDTILGSTPFTKSMKHGMYTLLFHKAGYDSLLKNITVEGKDDIPINVDLIRQQGYLRSAFEPQEAIVTIDGETVANNSTSILNTGSYKLTAKLTNYYLVNESVTISKDDTSHVNHTLQYGLDDYKKLLKQNKKHGKLFIIPAVMSIATYAVKTYYNSKYEDATSELVKSHYLGIHDTFNTAFTASSSITLGAGLYITYNKQRAKTLKFKLSL